MSSITPTRERIVDFLDDFDDRPGSGLDTHKKLKILIKHAIDIGWMKGDPMVGLNRPIIKTEAGIGFTVAGFSDWFR